jgi:hypothetical protein
MSNPATLEQFFGIEGKGRWSPEELERNQEFSELKEVLTAEAPGLGWTGAFAKVAEEIPKLFQVSTTDIMVKAWNNFRILFKYLNQEHYPPDEVIYLELGEHTIKSEHHPHIEIILNGKTIKKILFHILVTLNFKEVTLKIQDGKIKEITPVSCEGKGVCKLGEFDLLERKTGPIEFLARMDLGDGIPITA